MSRSDSGRGESTRASFSRATRSAVLAARGPEVSLATANRIVRAGDDAKARVTARYAKQDDVRTSKAYGDRLVKLGLPREPMPTWAATDPQAKLMAQARTDVANDLSRQLGRLDRAQTRMLKSGQVRATRKISWGRGLGE